MLRILFANDFADMGGAEIALLDLLGGLDRKQFDAEVLLFEDGPFSGHLRGKGVQVHQILFPQAVLRAPIGAGALNVVKLVKPLLHSIGRVKAVARHLDREKYEIVVTNSLKALLITWLALRMAHAKIRHVHYLHHILPERKTLATRLITELLSGTHCLVGNSEATLRRLRQHRVLRGRTVVIRQGFDRVVASREAPPTPYWTIGSAGRLDPVKNYEFIINTAKLLRARYPNLRVRLVGATFTETDRRYKAHLKEHIEQQGMQDIVSLEGFTQDIWGFMDSIQVFMLCSHTESFGRVLAEAMWSGKPVVATRVGAIPEIVRDGVTGYTVPLGDVTEAARLVELLINDPGHSRQLGRAGRAYAEENLSRRSYVADWEQCLRMCQPC